MAYVRVSAPSEVYHLTKIENLDSILDDGKIRRFTDSECWFCESLPKMKAYMEQTVLCEGKPYYAVGGQLCRYPKFVPEDYVLIKLTPRHAEDRWYRWNQEIPPGSPKELVQAATEFSLLKIGYRGNLVFHNAEVIDVPQFLASGRMDTLPIRTYPELRDAFFEKIEQGQAAYTALLSRMMPEQLIANAEEIAANHFCYNEIYDAHLSREELEQLLSVDDPLEYLGGIWNEVHGVGSSEEFTYAVSCLCEKLQQRQELTM